MFSSSSLAAIYWQILTNIRRQFDSSYKTITHFTSACFSGEEPISVFSLLGCQKSPLQCWQHCRVSNVAQEHFNVKYPFKHHYWPLRDSSLTAAISLNNYIISIHKVYYLYQALKLLFSRNWPILKSIYYSIPL